MSETVGDAILEAICKQCGKCCHYKLELLGRRYVSSSLCCKHLDKSTKKCKDYHNRFNLGVGCLSIPEAIEHKALPKDCGYVQFLDDYDGPDNVSEILEEVFLKYLGTKDE